MRKNSLFSALAAIAVIAVSCSNDGDSGSNEDNVIIKPRTSIADAAFEQTLVELGIDDTVDGSVLTENVERVTSLVMDNKGITSLQGIADFTVLENLSVIDNQISSLDLSSNTTLKFVFVDNNDLTSINVTRLTILEKLSIPGNNVTLLNISDNTALQLLNIKDNTLGAIDLSNIPSSLQLNTFAVENNPLTCIEVNDQILNDIPPQWTKDPEDNYALTCN